jgi:hypothetical protein
VAAKIIAKIFGKKKLAEREVWQKGKHFALDDEVNLSALRWMRRSGVREVPGKDLDLPEELRSRKRRNQ